VLIRWRGALSQLTITGASHPAERKLMGVLMTKQGTRDHEMSNTNMTADKLAARTLFDPITNVVGAKDVDALIAQCAPGIATWPIL
jgi:hypothetical protein